VLAGCLPSLNGQLQIDDQPSQDTEALLEADPTQDSYRDAARELRPKFYKPSRSPTNNAERSKYKHHRPSRQFEANSGPAKGKVKST
jgi:hypothetical protein